MTNSADPYQLAFEKPTDLALHCLQKQCISGFSSTRVKTSIIIGNQLRGPVISGNGQTNSFLEIPLSEGGGCK